MATRRGLGAMPAAFACAVAPIVAFAAPIAAFASPSAALATPSEAPSRLALASDDRALAHAVGLALEAWNVEVVPSAAQRPAASPDAILPWARAVAAGTRASWVVWIARGTPLRLAWYDVRAGHVHEVDLGVSDPLDDSAAASVALTLKAALSPELAVVEGAPAGPAPDGRRASVAGPPEPTWQAAASEGVRWLGAHVESRTATGIRTWMSIEGVRCGLGVDLSGGTGIGIDDDIFRGHWIDVAVSPSLRARWRPWRRAVLELAIGPSVHLLSFWGTAVDGHAPRAIGVDGSLDAEVALSFDLGAGIELGPTVDVSYWFRYESYKVRDQLELSLPPIAVEAEAQLRVRLR